MIYLILLVVIITILIQKKIFIFALLVVTAINTKLIGSNAIKRLDVAVTMSGHFNNMEIWKVIDGYEDYQISSLGRVKSKQRYNTKGGILKPNKSRGYTYLHLSKNGERKTFRIHILVAMAFHGHIPDGHNSVVDHIDNDKLNNRADNLQIITARENLSKDKRRGKSSFIGVTRVSKSVKWHANIRFKGRRVHLGNFVLETDAANAYQKALKEVNQGLDLNVIYPKIK